MDFSQPYNRNFQRAVSKISVVVAGPTIMDKTPMAQWTRKSQRVGRKPTKFADCV